MADASGTAFQPLISRSTAAGFSTYPLAPLTTLRIGGPAKRFVEARTEVELIETVANADAVGEPLLVLAGGSNVVIADKGFSGTVVGVATRGIEAQRDGDDIVVTAAAGEQWDRLVARAVADHWSGIEALSGIPGSLGAAPIQNIGAYGHEIAEVLHCVRAYDRHSREIVTINATDCGFGYRTSRFKSERDRWVLLDVTLRLVGDRDSAPVRYHELASTLGLVLDDRALGTQVRRAVLELRRAKGMVLDIEDHDTWSVGSFFTNPIVAESRSLPDEAPRWPAGDGYLKTSAAWLIENAGFGRGWSISPQAQARLSTKHPLAITNRGSATATDILELASVVRTGVLDTFGVKLVPEPVLVGCSL